MEQFEVSFGSSRHEHKAIRAIEGEYAGNIGSVPVFGDFVPGMQVEYSVAVPLYVQDAWSVLLLILQELGHKMTVAYFYPREFGLRRRVQRNSTEYLTER
jgi:hypothetical protein